MRGGGEALAREPVCEDGNIVADVRPDERSGALFEAEADGFRRVDAVKLLVELVGRREREGQQLGIDVLLHPSTRLDGATLAGVCIGAGAAGFAAAISCFRVGKHGVDFPTPAIRIGCPDLRLRGVATGLFPLDVYR